MGPVEEKVEEQVAHKSVDGGDGCPADDDDSFDYDLENTFHDGHQVHESTRPPRQCPDDHGNGYWQKVVRNHGHRERDGDSCNVASLDACCWDGLPGALGFG